MQRKTRTAQSEQASRAGPLAGRGVSGRVPRSPCFSCTCGYRRRQPSGRWLLSATCLWKDGCFCFRTNPSQPVTTMSGNLPVGPVGSRSTDILSLQSVLGLGRRSRLPGPTASPSRLPAALPAPPSPGCVQTCGPLSLEALITWAEKKQRHETFKFQRWPSLEIR